MAVEPIAVAFANTRSSKERDLIATLPHWQDWIDGWPGLRSVGLVIDLEGLIELRSLRDDVQLVLRSAAAELQPATAAFTRVSKLAMSASGLALKWQGGRHHMVVISGQPPVAALIGLFARAAIELLAVGSPQALCEGQNCLKLFVPSRSDRRWCDSAVCGNRARVQAHSRRRTTAES